MRLKGKACIPARAAFRRSPGGTPFGAWLAPVFLALAVLASVSGLCLALFGSSTPDAGLTMARDRLLAEPGLTRAVLLALAAGLGATLASIAVTIILLTHVLASGSETWTRRLVGPLMAMPHAAVAVALTLLIAPSGLLVRLIAQGPIPLAEPPDLALVGDRLGLSLMAGLAIKETSFLVLMALPALGRVRAAQRFAVARCLGAAPAPAFLRGVWPLLHRELRLPILAVLVYSISVVDVALILGPSTPPTLGVLLLRLASAGTVDARAAAGLGAGLLVALCLAAGVLWTTIERLGGPAVGALDRLFVRHRRFARLLARGFSGGVHSIGALLAPLLVGVLVLAALSAGRAPFPAILPPRFEFWASLDAREPIMRLAPFSLGLALVTALFALALALPAVEARRAAGRTGRPAWSLAPLLLPELALFLGLDVVLARFGWSGSMFALGAAHLVIVLPYVLLSLAEPWARIHPHLAAAAVLLGERRPVLAVLVPMHMATLSTAFAVGVAVSLAQYLATQVAGAGRWPTLTTEAVALAAGGERRLVALLGLAQTILPAIAFAAAAGVPWFMRRVFARRVF